MRVTIELEPEAEARWAERARSNGLGFSEYVARLMAAVPPEGLESFLEERIRNAVPPELQKRFSALYAKRRAGVISEEELAELMRLTDEIEGIDVRRLEWLAQLAALRGTSVDSLIDHLGLRPVRHD